MIALNGSEITKMILDDSIVSVLIPGSPGIKAEVFKYAMTLPSCQIFLILAIFLLTECMYYICIIYGMQLLKAIDIFQLDAINKCEIMEV